MVKPFKIRVKNEHHSKEIQQYLFEQRVLWYGGGTSVINTDKPFLLVYQAPPPWNAYVTYTDVEGRFNNHPEPEKWFYGNKLQDQPQSKDALLEELHSVLDKYYITISLVQDYVNNYIMLLESESDETLGVSFEDKINSEAIQEYIDACIIRGLEFEQSRLFEPHIVNYLGKDIPVPYTFKRGWLATDKGGDVYVYRKEPAISVDGDVFYTGLKNPPQLLGEIFYI